MAAPEKKNHADLPGSLRRQFVDVEQRLWHVETVTAACLGLGGFLGSYLLLFISDRLWDTPSWLRLLLLTAALGTACVAVCWWVFRWVLRRRDTRALAKLVQKRHRRLGDRLLGIVELADEKEHPGIFSPSLYRAAIRQVAGEAGKLDFRATVNPKPARRRTLEVAVLSIMVITPWFFIPEAVKNTLERWYMPVADIKRHTLVNLSGFKPYMPVPRGEPFEVEGDVDYDSFWEPDRAIARYNGGVVDEAGVTNNHVRFIVPGQVERGQLTIRVGDASHALDVEPVHRPALSVLNATIRLPEYLGYPEYNQEVRGGSLEVQLGSRVSFSGEVSRDLDSARIQIGDGDTLGLPTDGASFSSSPASLDDAFECIFSWIDILELPGAAPWRLSVVSREDLPPRPDLGEISREVAILESEVLEIHAAALDDYGVKMLGLDWSRLGGLNEEKADTGVPMTAEASSAQQKDFPARFHFSPAVLGIPKDSTVEIAAWATDYKPGRDPARTPPVRVHVLGNEEHAERVRQKLESLLEQLEEVTRTEENLTESTRELASLDKSKMEAEETTDKIAEAEQEQDRNQRDLENMAREGAMTLREAMRNPAFDESVLREWTQNLQQMDELAQGQMKNADKQLAQAEQQASSPGKRKESLEEALEEQESALDALSELQDRINQALDDLQALTLAQRLRKLGREELAIRDKIKKTVPDTIGLLPKDLPERFRRSNDRFARSQGVAQEQAGVLQGEISRFYERTGKGQYGDVSREMETEKTSELLDDVRIQIATNIAMQAIRNLGNWAARFEEWAKKLEPPKQENDGDGGGGGGGGEQNSADQLMKQLLSLLRLRESEVGHQRQTTLLEERKKETVAYQKGVVRLGELHADSMLELNRLQFENNQPALTDPLQDAFDTMEKVSNFLAEPRTDQQTVASQKRTIEMLSDAINLINEEMQQNQQGAQGQSSAAQEMAFLMQMMALQQQAGMGAQQNQTGGGSEAGGDTDQTASRLSGNAEGGQAEQRSVDRGSGRAAKLPEEFREALEDYFKAVEVFEEGARP